MVGGSVGGLSGSSDAFAESVGAENGWAGEINHFIPNASLHLE